LTPINARPVPPGQSRRIEPKSSPPSRHPKEKFMSEHYHAAVWIDGHEARVFRFNAEEMEKTVFHPHHSDKERRREKQSGHESPDDAQFLESVTLAIADAGAILISGPGLEKTVLLKYIEKKHPGLKNAIEAMESADHPSDGEVVAHARKVLKVEDRMKPQI
jgi:stalled ribosome rescue protein Dom34